MQPGEIKVGGCYRTAINEVRNVLEITSENRVIFRARNSSYAKGEAGWYQANATIAPPMLSTFAYSVVGPVPCDWDSRTMPVPLPTVPGITIGTKGQEPKAAAEA